MPPHSFHSPLSLQVKDAYAKLTDEVLKKNLLMHIENAAEDYKKERRKLVNKGVSGFVYIFSWSISRQVIH